MPPQALRQSWSKGSLHSTSCAARRGGVKALTPLLETTKRASTLPSSVPSGSKNKTLEGCNYQRHKSSSSRGGMSKVYREHKKVS